MSNTDKEVLSKCDGYELICRYCDKDGAHGMYYIRFWDDGLDMPCELYISPKTAARIIEDPVIMKNHVNDKKEIEDWAWTADLFFCMGIYDYLLCGCHYVLGRELDTLYDRLHRYPDICWELYMYIMEGKFPEKPIKVKGLTAADIIRDYHLTVPGAYSYMVHLREESVSSAIHNMLDRHQSGQREEV